MWAQDFLAEHPAKKHIINDSKTPSGPVHIGSFRSLVIHDVLKRILDEEKHPAVYHYGFDD
jgi:lysyl-tRNA synthetase class 1